MFFCSEKQQDGGEEEEDKKKSLQCSRFQLADKTRLYIVPVLRQSNL
jgi:hypothetical protein